MSDRPQNDRVHSERKTAAVTAIINKNVPVENQLRGFRHAPTDKDEQDALGVELVEFVCHPSITDIEEFPLSKRMNPYRFYKMREKNEFFAECLQTAKYLCALHLKKAGYAGDIPSNIVLALLPTLNQEYREMIIERVTKKIEAHIKAHQAVSVPWAEEMWRADMKEKLLKEIANERTDNSEQLQATSLSNEIPQSTNS